MKNILKLAIVLLTTFSLSFSANAGELTVTGTAKATYNIQSSDSLGASNELGKGLGITNELNFGASGELDNGFTWTYSVALDPGEVDGGTSADNDDTAMTIGTPYGTIGLYISANSLNKQLAFSAAAYAPGIDLGVGAINDPVGLSSFNSIQYTTPADLLPFGTTFQVGYAPSSDTGAASSGNSTGVATGAVETLTSNATFAPTNVASATEYAIVTKPVDGLTVSASYVDIPSARGVARSQDYEAGAINAKYAFGPITVGYGKTLIQPFVLGTGVAAGTDRVMYQNTTDWSIGYAVNENLSLSYESSSSVQKMRQTSVTGTDTNSDDTQDMQAIQAAYTMGGMTLAVSQVSVDGDGYTKEAAAASRVDVKETIFAVTMAF
jgi:hypothetical protein